MTQFLQRLCFFGFVGLFAAISFNAVYLQEGDKKRYAKVSRPLSTAALPDKKVVPVRRKVTTKKLSSEKRRTRKVPSKGLVRAVQRELKAQSYFPGGTDGIPGIMTSAAIMAYEHDHGFSLTGEPSEELLKRLLLGPSHGQKNDGPKKGNSLRSIHTTKAVQQVLSSLGYSPGEIDGMVGRETSKAIRSFEKDRGLKQTGRISGLLIKEINRVTGEDLTVLAQL